MDWNYCRHLLHDEINVLTLVMYYYCKKSLCYFYVRVYIYIHHEINNNNNFLILVLYYQWENIHVIYIQGDSGGICETWGNDSMCDSKQKSSYKHVSDFRQLRSYGHFLNTRTCPHVNRVCVALQARTGLQCEGYVV
jgi:hypothetical protein